MKKVSKKLLATRTPEFPSERFLPKKRHLKQSTSNILRSTSMSRVKRRKGNHLNKRWVANRTAPAHLSQVRLISFVWVMKGNVQFACREISNQKNTSLAVGTFSAMSVSSIGRISRVSVHSATKNALQCGWCSAGPLDKQQLVLS